MGKKPIHYALRVALGIMWIVANLSVFAATPLNPVIFKVTRDGNLRLNQKAFTSSEDIESYKSDWNGITPVLRVETMTNRDAVFNALNLLADSGVKKVELAGNDVAYPYKFPVADGFRSSPWKALLFANRRSIPASEDILQDNQRPEVKAVFVHLSPGHIESGTHEGLVSVSAFLKSLSNKSSYVGIDFLFGKDTTYRDILIALEVARKGGICDYCFSKDE